MKKVFVTGPDGLLGSNLLRSLLKRGYKVKAMVQPGNQSPTLEGLDIEKVEIDLLDIDSLIAAVEGCDYLIHVAAITSVWPSKGDIYERINVTGTEHVIAAALKHKIERMIYVGSASSFGFGPQDQPGTEESPFKSAKYGLEYITSKRKAQIRVLEAVEKQGLPALVVNPTFMIGPYDSKPSSGAMIVAAAKGKVPGYTSGGKNWVAVKDVAEGICQALEKGRVGQCYIMGHQNLSYKEALSIISTVVGRKPPKLPVPNFLVKMGGFFGSTIAMITRKPPALSYPMAWISCDGHYFSPAKAVKELQMPQTPLEEAVKEAYDWFCENGYIHG